MSGVLLESRPFRPFKSSEEYLYAMKEDLAEWLQMLYPHLRINVENFMDRLETGVALCELGIVSDPRENEIVLPIFSLVRFEAKINQIKTKN
ncbi:hypothetical protein QE152_g6239 [Popillia japonica]|uniref:GAS2-like protein 2 n=1 Tax=Popillia japonica TaxID=7064 RepID=A0AAW1MJ07_POPJA